VLRDRNSVKQLAAHRECSTGTIYRLIRAGELARMGGPERMRVSREEAERYERGTTPIPLAYEAAGPITFAMARATNDAYQLGRLIAGREIMRQRAVKKP
jgi:hypothetical protein